MCSSTSSIERPPRPARGPALEAPASVSGPPAELPAGRVGRAHGLDGSFYVTGAAAAAARRSARASTSAGAAREIVRRSGTDARPIVRLEGVDDRDGAEALRGIDADRRRGAARRSSARASGGRHELEGCEVFDGERLLGTVSRLIELPSCEAIEVRAPTAAIRCSCRWSETRSASVDVARAADRRRRRVPRSRRARASARRRRARRRDDAAGEGVAMEIDVFTLFPEWFEWFSAPAPRRQRARARARG